MDKPLPAEPSSSAQATEKIAAVGRRVKSEVKSALSSNKNEPSVRIIRDSKGNKQRVPTEKRGSTQPPTPSRYADDHTIPAGDNEKEKGKKSWFGGLFGKKSESHTNPQQDGYERNDCYDRETVDLLDVVGMYPNPTQEPHLTLRRPRSINPLHLDQRPKLSLRPLNGKDRQPPSNLQTARQRERSPHNRQDSKAVEEDTRCFRRRGGGRQDYTFGKSSAKCTICYFT